MSKATTNDKVNITIEYDPKTKRTNTYLNHCLINADTINISVSRTQFDFTINNTSVLETVHNKLNDKGKTK